MARSTDSRKQGRARQGVAHCAAALSWYPYTCWGASQPGEHIMPYPTFARAVLGAIVILLLQLAPAQAQFSLFVATSGADADTCFSPATACRTLQRALDAAPAGSKIIVLDSDSFGFVTINKSIAIAATGVHANVFGSSATQITINAGPNDAVYLEGLAMGRTVLSGANSGIEFNSGGKLHVRNCVIRNFGTAGIDIRGAGSKQVFISDCTIANNRHGILARPGNGNALVFLDRVTVEGNLRDGVRSQGSGATVRLNNSTITHNGTGLARMNGGRLISFGNNAIRDNDTDGAPTATQPLR
ncbi:MAG: hypothetical protein GEU91_09570 [Rhizobiales bacterium]|nr:hypothetical protein [Hyphomicrobiales bacterium]